MFSSLINFVREQYQSNELIPLHSPVFSDIERSYVNEADLNNNKAIRKATKKHKCIWTDFGLIQNS